MSKKLCCQLVTACAVVIGSASATAQPMWDDLEPGVWVEVSSNTIEDVDPCPASDCAYSAVEGISGVIDDWNGGAFASGYGGLGGLVVWGGGHNGYFGSELYVFDLATGLWVRETEPYDNGGASVAPDCNDDGVYPDGSPCPAHTYDRVDYHPPTNSFVILSGTPDPVCGGCDDNRAHLYDFDTGVWTLGAERPNPGSVTGATSAWDASRNLFWFLPTYTQAFTSYDPVADEWTDYGDVIVTEIDGNSVHDPERDLFLWLDTRGSQSLYAIDLTAPDSGLVELTTAGGEGILDKDKAGFDYDPSTDQFLAWHDGQTVFVLTPPDGDWRTATWQWEARVPVDPAQSATPVRGVNGTYSRFRYAATVNAFVLVSHVDGPVWAYRHAPGAGTGPVDPPDMGSEPPDMGTPGADMSPDPIPDLPVDMGSTANDAGDRTSTESTGGCSCSSTGADANPFWLLLFAAFVRRRRPRGSR